MRIVTSGPAEDLAARTQRMLQETLELVAVRWEEQFEHVAQKCESPIERHLLLGLMSANDGSYERIEFSTRKIDFQTFKPIWGYEENNDAMVFLQVEIGPYRVDMLIYDQSRAGKEPRWIVVECDGHQYHERTKEQARRDKQRDRFLARLGIRVLRFTGSEIYADVDACAHEIIDNLYVNNEIME